jgi:endonuclease III
LQKEFPGLNPEPVNSDPLDVLIATILSQNTTDKTSYIAFRNLKTRFKDWDDVLSAPVQKVKNAVKVCGLSNQKTKTILDLLKSLKVKNLILTLDYFKNYENDRIYSELLQYKGIGMKTISCVLAFGLGRDVFPVDTHVHRLVNRLGLVKTSSPDKTFQEISELIPAGKRFLFHTLLIRFGRKICRSKKPLCSKCILYDYCTLKDKEEYAELSTLNKIIPKDNNFIVLEHI